MPRLYLVEGGRFSSFVPGKAKAISKATDLSAVRKRPFDVVEYETIECSPTELSALILNGQRWWYSKRIIATVEPHTKQNSNNSGEAAHH